MPKPKGKSNMLIPTIIMAVLTVILFTIATVKGQGQNIASLKIGYNLLIQVLPLLFFAFILAGLIQTMLPKDLLSNWVGTESGIRGIIIGTIAGGLTPGGPYVSLPIVAGLVNSGASVGTMVAFLTSWSLWAVARLPMEFGILGWKFTLLRVASTFIFPPIAGVIANLLSKTLFKM